MISKLMALCAVLLASTLVTADPAAPAWLPPELIDRAVTERSETPATESYRWVTGAIKKVDNRWRAEHEQDLGGHLIRATYQLPEDITYRDAEQRLRKAIADLPEDAVEYLCEGLDCGSSHAWANQVFNIKQLYGLDGSQLYAALQVVTAGATEYTAVYLVQRGNRRIYMQVDRLLPTPSVAEALEGLARYGYWLAVAGSAEDLDVKAAEALLAAARGRGLSLALVAHDMTPGASAARLARSETQANAAAVRLAAAELGKIPSFGVGDLAPRPGASAQRLEWVVFSPAQ